jgi:hypothetical protein
MAAVAEKSATVQRGRRLQVASVHRVPVRVLPQRPPSIAMSAGRTWTQELLACWRLLAMSSVLLAVALYANYYCGVYVTFRDSVKVPDLVLDCLPVIDLSFLFTYGYMALIVGMFSYPILRRVRMLHVVAIQFSLLLLLRSGFMIFTHLGTPAGAVSVHFPGFFGYLYFENDMFFSGHTAMPFLGFYLFRHSALRYAYLVGALVMGMVVLLMHVHYTVDVLAAYFMTYASYQMGNALLSKLDPAGGR